MSHFLSLSIGKVQKVKIVVLLLYSWCILQLTKDNEGRDQNVFSRFSSFFNIISAAGEGWEDDEWNDETIALKSVNY